MTGGPRYQDMGYGLTNTMYYVREKGAGLAGIEIIDGMSKVHKNGGAMKKCLNLTLMKGKTVPSDINT